MAAIATRNINGVECLVFATEVGSWEIYEAKADGENGVGEKLGHHEATLDGAVINARKTINKRKIEVEFRFKDRDGNELIATGFDGHGELKIVKPDGTVAKGIEGRKYVGDAYPVDTPDGDLALYRGHKRDAHEHEAQAREFEREHALDVRTEVRNAIEAALAQREGEEA